jgi:hypothetical protein
MKESKLLIKHIESKETSTASYNEYTYNRESVEHMHTYIVAPRWNMIRNQPNCKQHLCHVVYPPLHHKHLNRNKKDLVIDGKHSMYSNLT